MTSLNTVMSLLKTHVLALAMSRYLKDKRPRRPKTIIKNALSLTSLFFLEESIHSRIVNMDAVLLSSQFSRISNIIKWVNQLQIANKIDVSKSSSFRAFVFVQKQEKHYLHVCTSAK